MKVLLSVSFLLWPYFLQLHRLSRQHKCRKLLTLNCRICLEDQKSRKPFVLVFLSILRITVNNYIPPKEAYLLLLSMYHKYNLLWANVCQLVCTLLLSLKFDVLTTHIGYIQSYYYELYFQLGYATCNIKWVICTVDGKWEDGLGGDWGGGVSWVKAGGSCRSIIKHSYLS